MGDWWRCFGVGRRWGGRSSRRGRARAERLARVMWSRNGFWLVQTWLSHSPRLFTKDSLWSVWCASNRQVRRLTRPLRTFGPTAEIRIDEPVECNCDRDPSTSNDDLANIKLAQCPYDRRLGTVCCVGSAYNDPAASHIPTTWNWALATSLRGWCWVWPFERSLSHFYGLSTSTTYRFSQIIRVKCHHLLSRYDMMHLNIHTNEWKPKTLPLTSHRA